MSVLPAFVGYAECGALAALRGEVGAARVLAVTPETYVAVEADHGRRVAEWILVHSPLRLKIMDTQPCQVAA